MSKQSGLIFVTELPLRVTPKQESTILVRFGYGRQMYNACLGESLRRLNLMRQSKAYQSACYVPKTDSHKKERGDAFRVVRRDFGFSAYDLNTFAGTIKLGWIGSSIVQAVATRAFNAANRHAFGKAGKPRFKGVGQIHSLEGKQNTVLSWKNNTVIWGGLVLPAIMPDPGRKGSAVLIHGLAAPVKYVRLVLRRLNGKNRFYAQLVCEGSPYQKPKNTIGKGRVGLDIGPSTIAMVAPDVHKSELRMFCNELGPDKKQIKRLQRKQDRQRRSNNPDNYTSDGTIYPGKKHWRKSLRYEQTQSGLAEVQRRVAEHRKSLHGQMVNHIISLGNEIKLEKLSYRAFQKMYGRSVGMRAPGKFVELLKRKAVSAGVFVTEFSTRTTRLSQTCICGAVVKKPLSQRWQDCSCGVRAQRDLFSAFLASCVEGDRLNADLANEYWRSGMETCLQAALSDIQPATGGLLPSSFGLIRRQSGSPVKVWMKTGNVQNVVASAGESLCQRRESEKTCSDFRTPGLETWGVSGRQM